jgi:alpha-mannosidase
MSKRNVIRAAAAWAGCALSSAAVFAAEPPASHIPDAPVDFAKKPTLYAVGYAHLDTQWRWSYPQVVRQFLKDTLDKNPPLLDKYPHYVFNFTGARRYQLMKEYYPAEYARMAEYIRAGRWFPGGSNVDETDQNVPSAESVVRHVLYGNHFFKKEFGVTGVDFQVPDCFGFPFSLPTVLAHCSIKGFSTAKLRWGGASDFWKQHPVGVWEGVDGESVIASFDPTPYDSHVDDDLTRDPKWIARAEANGKASGGVAVDYRYYGTGDRGGAPAEASVANVEKSVTSDGPLRVISATSDQMFRDITPAERAKLPRYKGDLLLTWHSSGSINSQAYMKRWNRKNELLADAAERASVAASWLGGTPYPTQKLYDSWMLLLEGQMHDILPGDCLPKCYEYSWNDEILAANGFAAAEQNGVAGVAAALDTQAHGVPLVVYNPLSVERTDPVEATVSFPSDAPDDVNVTEPDGTDCPAQVLSREGPNKLRVLFLAKVPGNTFATFGVASATSTDASDPGLRVGERSLENGRYRVTINDAGDVEQIVDKANGGAHLLSAPLRLGFLHQNPSQYPAWNMDWEDRQKQCQSYVDGPATIRVVETGPVRVALEITREARGSKFTQRVQLTRNGTSVDFPTHIDWQTPECSLEAVMPLGVSAPTATYDTQVGVTVRGNNNPRKYEVPQQQWFDVTAADGHYGVGVLNDCKFGSDKPDDKTVRLTLLYTPGVRAGYQDEGSQDFGRHDMTYALTGHTGDWREGHDVAQGARLNQPLVPFQTTAHDGTRGKQFTLVTVSNPAVTIQSIKKAEDSDEIIVRLKETTDRPVDGVRLTFAAPVASAREVDGQEAEIGKATVTDGNLVTDLKPFHLKAFAVRLASAAAPVAPAVATTVDLPFDTDVVSSTSDLKDGGFDADGRTYPAEQFPGNLVSDGVPFKLGQTGEGQKNAVTAHGQTVSLPAGTTRVFLLAAANGDQTASFKVGDKTADVVVQDWGGYIGSWDNRLWKGKVSELTYNWANRLDGLVPGFIKRADVAWYADHRHHPDAGNEIWNYCYLFKYGIDVPAGATTLTLPANPAVRVFAVTATTGGQAQVTPARPLYDTLADHVADGAPTAAVVEAAPASGATPVVYHDGIHVRLDHPLYWQDGQLRFTTDGSEPTATSPAYAAPLFLSQPTTVKAREFDATGKAGPMLEQRFDVRDTTGPRVLSAQGLTADPQVRVTFSEPVTPQSAEAVEHYRFDPPLTVSAAHLQGDGKTVVVDLTSLPTGDHAEHLTVADVRDVSPAGNAVQPGTVSVDLVKPVVTIASYSSTRNKPPLERKVAGLPTKSTDPWTMSCLVRTNSVPGDTVVLAGFGKCEDESGMGRYLCAFSGDVHYWSSNQDVTTDAPLDAGPWQMVSATWDGHTMTVFKDGKPVASGELTLSPDDESTIRLAPAGPWGSRDRFAGEIRDFTVWPVALSPHAVQAMWDARKPD